MDTTDAPQTARSQRSNRQDPATVWAPLAGLADAATRLADSGAVAITRGFDRNSRQRAKALRELLGDQGVSAIEVTPLPDSERLLADSEIATVVNLVGAGSWQPYRLAAKLRTPVLTPNPTDGAPAAEAQRDVIGMTGESGARDVALSHVAVRPEDADTSSITITSQGEPLSIPGGWVSVTPEQGLLRIELAGTDFAEHTFTAQEVRIETFDGPHRLVRDELPIAEFEGALTFTAEPQGLVVRPV